MDWQTGLSAIEALEDAEFDPALLSEMQAQPPSGKPILFSTPTFKDYASSELEGCGRSRFPAFSITASACALQCEHCRTKILEAMIPATSPEELDRKVRDQVMLGRLGGFLLSGGSNRRNEIPYERYYPVVERLKRDFPHLKIACHSALLDDARARTMASAGIDTAMIDIIGADETIREIYHLDRPVADFESSLAALTATSMQVVPHIVIGLHFGRLLGEERALDIVSRYAIHALVLVVIMPNYAQPGRFAIPATADIGRIFIAARKRLPNREIQLGCARPPGLHKRVTDAYAVMAGLDGIAFPADGAVAVARMTGRSFEQQNACCAMKADSSGGCCA